MSAEDKSLVASQATSRDEIRELVATYNAFGDAGRLDELVDLFATDATMQVLVEGEERLLRGRSEIRSIFEETKAQWAAEASAVSAPRYVRHHVSTHRIDLVDATTRLGGATSW